MQASKVIPNQQKRIAEAVDYLNNLVQAQNMVIQALITLVGENKDLFKKNPTLDHMLILHGKLQEKEKAKVDNKEVKK